MTLADYIALIVLAITYIGIGVFSMSIIQGNGFKVLTLPLKLWDNILTFIDIYKREPYEEIFESP